jgi:hypothetical protein
MISYLQKSIALREYMSSADEIVETLGQDPNFRDRKMQSLLVENIRVLMETGKQIS